MLRQSERDENLFVSTFKAAMEQSREAFRACSTMWSGQATRSGTGLRLIVMCLEPDNPPALSP